MTQIPETITDAQIDAMVDMVEAAELFARQFALTTGQGLRMMLKSAQAMERIKRGESLGRVMASLSARVQ